MKHLKRLCILSLALVLCCAVGLLLARTLPAKAATVINSGTCGDNLTWTLDSDGLLTISGTGAMKNYNSSYPYSDGTWYTTAPWGGSVANAQRVKTVVIEPGVTRIGEDAFSGCTGLTSVTIPDGVTSIGSYAFSGCSGLTSVSIGNGVTSIGGSAFIYCKNLTGVYITDLAAWCEISFSDYSAQPLYYAHNLYINGVLAEAITIPDSVTSIGSYAFSGCERLTSVTIPDGVTRIGNNAFGNYTHILCNRNSCAHTYAQEHNLAFGLLDGTEEENTFSGTYGKLTWTIDRVRCVLTVNCDGNMPNFSDSSNAPWRSLSDYVHSAVLADSVTRIGSYAFSGCMSLTSVTIPDSVTSIGNSAFYSCPRLTSVTIPDSVTSIGNYAFYYCGNLTSVTIGNGVTSIGESVFSGCKGLTSVTIGNSVTSIGHYAFSGCTALTSVTIPDSVTSIGGYAFEFCPGLTSITIPDSVTSIGAFAFDNCRGLTSVTIGNGVTRIGEDAFSGCTGLTSVTIPDSVTGIGGGAFNNCTSLTSVTIGNGVTSIGGYAFSGCTGLTSVVLPVNVKSVNGSAFRYCDTLQSVYIYNRECSIGNDTAIPVTAVIYGYSGSTAEKYADENGHIFREIVGHEHTFGAWTVTKPATATEEGVETRVCSVCGATETRTIPKTETPDNSDDPTPYAVTADNIGDVDGDGTVTASDARLALRAAVGLETFDEKKTDLADADRDGEITAADARRILRAAVGLEDRKTWFPV